MAGIDGGLIVIGENLNATRKIKATSPRVVRRDGRVGIGYRGEDGADRLLDCTDVMPEDPKALETFMVPHIAQALRNHDVDYIAWAIRGQEKAGARIIDLCVDEMSAYDDERADWMRWLVRTAQSLTDRPLAIDSSDSNTIRAGLDAYDRSKSRPAINSFNLEEGREPLAGLAAECGAIVFANASGREEMPVDAEGRVANLVKCMEILDAKGVAVEDRYLDPLVFPIGADATYGVHYLEAVRQLRALYPEVHIFGGHSNVSFGLPRRPLLNQAFTLLAIAAGCDAVMIDPIMNSPQPFEEFRFASEALLARDEFAMRYLQYCRQAA